MDILSLVDRGDLDRIRQSIFGATAAELNAASIKKRITPLHRAVTMNRPDIAALLLDHGADIDHRRSEFGANAAYDQQRYTA